MTKQEALAVARATARATGVKRLTRKQKMARHAATFQTTRQRFPRVALPMIDKAESGSLPAAVKLMCLDCSGWQRQEVRDCVIVGCPLYPHRPFQGKAPAR